MSPVVFARSIAMNFPSGSYCGLYSGEIAVNDIFTLNLGQNQLLVITADENYQYSVIAPNGRKLPVNNYISSTEKEFSTGQQSGQFRIKVNRTLDVTGGSFVFCAY